MWLGFAGCLKYSRNNEFPSFLYIAVASAAGMLLLLAIILLSVALVRRGNCRGRRSKGARRPPVRDGPSVPANSTEVGANTTTHEGAGGYSRHLSVVDDDAYDYDGYLVPNPAP